MMEKQNPLLLGSNQLINRGGSKSRIHFAADYKYKNLFYEDNTYGTSLNCEIFKNK
jgi:hypothetical protein